MSKGKVVLHFCEQGDVFATVDGKLAWGPWTNGEDNAEAFARQNKISVDPYSVHKRLRDWLEGARCAITQIESGENGYRVDTKRPTYD